MTFRRLAFALCLLVPAVALAHAVADSTAPSAWAPVGPTGGEVKALLIGLVVSLYLFGLVLGRRVRPHSFLRTAAEEARGQERSGG